MSSAVPSATIERSSPPRPQPSPPTAVLPARPAAAVDRVAAVSPPTAPLLTVAVASLAQLVPGVVEAEGAAAIATTIGVGVRAAMSNPVVGVAVGIVGSEAFDYVKTLAQDALRDAPAARAVATAAGALDAGVHTGLGIRPSPDR